MKTFDQFTHEPNIGNIDDTNEVLMTEADFKGIQTDALRHAAQLVHDMSRGTKSEERAIAIDEACDIIMDEIKDMAAMPNIPS